MAKNVQPIPNLIGPYKILQSLGKGGMGEVYLAQDHTLKRKLALKRIRPELKNNQVIQNRFLREAKVASVLTHPSIIPILTIENDHEDIYYTMPYVEGQTLKQIIRATKENPNHEIGRSLPSLARIFLQVCEAVSYTHSKGILHRDLKPENIIIGKFGEAMILDWGIADFIDQIDKSDQEEDEEPNDQDLTRPGKITGTLSYMAPERLLGQSSSVQTDLYALGVILYQLLTLKLPFERKTIAQFRKTAKTEELINPIEVAPYRDIPDCLTAICKKALSIEVKDRYKNVDEIIHEIKNYIEGKPEWILAASLDMKRKLDWQFQENVLLAKNIAITRNFATTQWAELMISKSSFASNLRLEAEVVLKDNGQGVGFLLSVPSHSMEEGYCLWVNSQSYKLFRNNVQMLEGSLSHNLNLLEIRIDKIDEHIRVFINKRKKFSYASHIPLAGSHVGLIHKDGHFDLKSFKVFDASHNVMVGCLAVPNAFLSHRLFNIALQEYRRIGESFPGRMEGREALFRAGLTLLEQARLEKDEKIYQQALKEFEKLYKTPGAPLEYLGKSLVYQALIDREEEAKCLELALRKFPKHPLISMIKEHIVYRIHESSLNDRESAYRIILLAIRLIPDLLENQDTKELIDSLEKNLEHLPFLKKSENRLKSIAIQLSFWLAKIPILVEIATQSKDEIYENAVTCLQELEAQEALEKLNVAFKKRKPLEIWSLLIEKRFDEAKDFFTKHRKEVFQETSPLHFAFGTYLYLTKGKQAAYKHFNCVLETAYPPTTALPALFLTNRLNGWMDKALWWEKKELHRQIELFYRLVGKKEKIQ